MSIDELRADLKRNMDEAKHFASMGQPALHLHETLWPFLEALVEIIDEQDDAIRELVLREENYLQPDTAAIFAAVVQSSMQLAAELQKRAAGDQAIAQAIAVHQQYCAEAVEILGMITVIPDEDEDDEEEDGDDDEAQADATTGGTHE